MTVWKSSLGSAARSRLRSATSHQSSSANIYLCGYTPHQMSLPQIVIPRAKVPKSRSRQEETSGWVINDIVASPIVIPASRAKPPKQKKIVEAPVRTVRTSAISASLPMSRQFVRRALPGAALRKKLTLPALCMAIALCIVAAESSSFLAYRLLTGTWMSYAAANEERRQIAAGVVDIDQGLLAGASGSGEMLQFVAHPYLGYVRQEGDLRAAQGQDYLQGKKPVVTAAQDGVAIVGIFGGSVAEQFSKFGSGALRQYLASDPRFVGKKIEIVTGAVAGYKQPQQLLAMNYLLSLGQHFDLILNIDGFNELAGPPNANIPNNVSPSFPTGWSYLADRMPNLDVLDAVGGVTHARHARRQLASSVNAVPLSCCSATLQYVWKGIDTVLTRRVASAQQELAHVAAAQPEITDPQPIAYKADGELLQELVGEWERSSSLMATIAQAQGIAYLHFLQPNQYVANAKPLSREEMRTAVNVNSPYRQWVAQGYPLLRQAGERLRGRGEQFHDLSTVFHNVPGTVYKDDCCHLNADGNALMAASIGQAIVAYDESLPRSAFAAR